MLSAQDRSVTNLRETGVWNGFYIKVRLSKKLGYYGEHNYRLANSLENINSFVGRTRKIYNRAGINILFNDYFEAIIGPTLVLNFSPQPGVEGFEKLTLEPRIWHQWLFKVPSMGKLTLYNQFRFEHRWRRSNVVGDTYQYTNRFRYKVFAYIPLNSDKIAPKTLYFMPSAEIFIHQGKSIVSNPMEDFRVYNGFGYILNPKVTFFAGHMWTVGQQASGFEYGTTHILRFNVYVGLDARKIEDRLPAINIGF